MITIQGFARLCGCNAQTLRYYDRIGLLTPARVDEWTGYRYYEEAQAMRFVKIKTLQQADFSIEEIRPLLEADDDCLIGALERKIEEQEQKLARIREIQRSYLRETMDMRQMVYALTNLMEGRMDNPLLWQELGMDDAREPERAARVHEVMADWLTQCRNASGEIAQSMDGQDISAMKEVLEKLSSGNPEEMKKLILSVSGEDGGAVSGIPSDARKMFSRDGWAHVSEWLGDLPALNDGKHHFLLFSVREDSPVGDPAFPELMLALMASEYDAMAGGVTCNVVRSGDGCNHFTLFERE